MYADPESSASEANPSTMTCDSLFSVLEADSADLRGSDYSTFADIINTMPGSYHFDTGSMGLPSPLSLFASPADRFELEFDGLLLNDPLTQKADLKLIPTESIGTIQVLQNQCSGYQTGPAIKVTTHDHSFVPLHSKIAYRPGNFFRNQLDVRLGVQLNPTFALNAGAQTRLFGGIMPHSRFRSESWNVKLDKQFKNVSLSYIWLQYRDHQRLPISGTLPGWESLKEPNQKQYRTDHALFFRFSQHISASIQATLYDRRDFAADYTIWNQSHHAKSLYIKAAYQNSFQSFQYQLGSFARLYKFSSDTWQDTEQSRSGGWIQVSRQNNKLKWQAGTHLIHLSENDFYLLPRLLLTLETTQLSKLSAFAGQKITPVSIEERYGQSPFGVGNDSLLTGRIKNAGLSWEITKNRLKAYLSLAVENREHMPAAAFRDGLIRYINLESHTCTSIDLLLDYTFSHWQTHGRIHANNNLSNAPVRVNRPDVYGRFYIAYRSTFFRNDLKLLLRVGGEFIGSREGSTAVYSDYSDDRINLRPALVPYAHLSAGIGDVDFFACIENFTGLNYQQIYGFDSPRSLIRYGLVWNFDD